MSSRSLYLPYVRVASALGDVSRESKRVKSTIWNDAAMLRAACRSVATVVFPPPGSPMRSTATGPSGSLYLGGNACARDLVSHARRSRGMLVFRASVAVFWGGRGCFPQASERMAQPQSNARDRGSESPKQGVHRKNLKVTAQRPKFSDDEKTSKKRFKPPTGF